MKLLTIDIGGTFIKYADWENGLGEVRELETPQDSLKSLVDKIGELAAQYKPQGLALSMPGFIDTEQGIARSGGKLDYIHDWDVVACLQKKLGIPVTVENDAKAATIAELRDGSLKGVENAIMLVFGTAVGGTVVANSEIVRGAHLMAGEFSFLSADMFENRVPIGLLCGAEGLSDCVCSKTEERSFLNGREIFKRANAGDEAVIAGIRKFCSRIVWLLYNLQVVTDPSVFAIGGGISQQPLFIKLLREEIGFQSKSEQYSFIATPQIVPCKYSAHANLVGAVYNFLDQTGCD